VATGPVRQCASAYDGLPGPANTQSADLRSAASLLCSPSCPRSRPDGPVPSAVSPVPSAVSPVPSAVSPVPSAVSPAPSAVSPAPYAVSPTMGGATSGPALWLVPGVMRTSRPTLSAKYRRARADTLAAFSWNA